MEAVLQLRAAIAAARREGIAGEALRMQPHQDGLRVVDDAHGEGQVFLPVGRAISNQPKVAVAGRQRGLGHALGR